MERVPPVKQVTVEAMKHKKCLETNVSSQLEFVAIRRKYVSVCAKLSSQ